VAFDALMIAHCLTQVDVIFSFKIDDCISHVYDTRMTISWFPYQAMYFGVMSNISARFLRYLLNSSKLFIHLVFHTIVYTQREPL